MNIKKVLVTGGAGFIGSHLVRRLLRDGYFVTVIDDLSEGKWENLPVHDNLKKVEASILDDLSIHFKNCNFVFHLAAIPRMQKSIAYPIETHRVNVDGTLNLLMLARKNKIKKFVFSSSSSVYGNQKKLPLKENMTPDPIVPYSLQKLTGEEYCKLFYRIWKVPTISLRYFNVYGTGMNPNGDHANLIPKFIKMLSENKIPTINGDGCQTRDFTYIDDVIEATVKAAKSKVCGDVINVGTGNNISVNAITMMLNEFMHKKFKVKYGPKIPEPINTIADITKAKKLLNWVPKTRFEEGLKVIISKLPAGYLAAKKE